MAKKKPAQAKAAPETPEPVAETAGESTAAAEASSTEIKLAYAGASKVATTEESAQLLLFGNLNRAAVKFSGTVAQPLKMRESLAALHAVVASDFRYIPKDRPVYLAYQRMRRETSGMNAWLGQQAYFRWLSRNDPLAFVLLDPIITVHPDQVMFEVFSKDEGSYAKLAISREAFETVEEPTYGTTNIDFSQTLFDGIQGMRSYRRTELHIAQQQVKVATESKGEVLEKQIHVPDTWLRGFLQVQSSAMLPCETFSLAPLDLYNVLRHLRMRADQKGKRRGLRIELIPGERPNLVLEPWETVVPTTSAPYTGKSAKVLRIWGRRRLMLLRRFLAFAEKIEVHLLGSGLPSFWVFRGQHMDVTLGLTGFTAANWSQAVSFDLLLPRKTQDSKELEQVVKHLSKTWSDSLAGLTKATGLKNAELLEALQLGCQQGQLMYDLAADVFRLRPLTNVPLNMDRLEYRNQRERAAHDLLARKGAVSITSENRIFGSGLELTGKVTVAEDKREYRPQMLLSEEGQVSKAECTCNFFRSQGLKHGPCACLISLRLAYAQEVKRRQAGQAGKHITVETRSYSKRQPDGEQVYQITLDRKRVKMRHGSAGSPLRVQTLQFNSLDSARHDYLHRIESLTTRGFLESSAE